MTIDEAYELIRFCKATKMPFAYTKDMQMVTIGEAYKTIGYIWDEAQGWVKPKN